MMATTTKMATIRAMPEMRPMSMLLINDVGDTNEFDGRGECDDADAAGDAT